MSVPQSKIWEKTMALGAAAAASAASATYSMMAAKLIGVGLGSGAGIFETNPFSCESGKEAKIEKLEGECKRVETRLDDLKAKFEYKSLTDNLAHDRDREELDFLSNKRKEFKIIVTGLSGDKPHPVNVAERLDWTKNIVSTCQPSVTRG